MTPSFEEQNFAEKNELLQICKHQRSQILSNFLIHFVTFLESLDRE